MNAKNHQQPPEKELEIVRRQLTECKASEARQQKQINALKESEGQFNIFIENLPYPIISYALDGSIQYANKKAEEVTEYSRKELIGKKITDPSLVSKESIPALKASLEKRPHSKLVKPYELAGLSKSGTRIILEVVEVPVRIEGKSEVFIIARDITKKKLADQKAAHLEFILRSIRSANISSSSKKNRKLTLEKACEHLIQVHNYENAWIVLFDENTKLITSAKAGIGHEFKFVVNQFKTGKLLKCVKSSLKHENVIVTENPLTGCCECPLSMSYYGIGCISIRFKYDNSYGVIVVSVPLKIVNDKEEHSFLHEVSEQLSSALHNIEIEEERRLIEGTARENEEKLRQILEYLNVGIWQIDAEGKTIYINPRMARMLGYSENELYHKRFFDFLNVNDRQKATHSLKQHNTAKLDQYQINFIKKDWAVLNTNLEILPISNEENEPAGAIISIQDISEQKRIEENLKESERRYRMLADNVSDVIMLMDMNLKPVYFSPSVNHVLGYSVEEALSGSMEQRMPPSSIDKAVKQFQSGLNEERRHPGRYSTKTIELEMVHKNGSIIDIEMKVSFIRDQDSKLTGLLGILRDVTKRKRVEESLRLSEEKLRILFETVGVGITITDMTGTIVDINEAVLNLTGFSRKEEVLGKNGFDFIAEHDRKRATESMLNTIKHKRGSSIELSLLRKDGSEFDAEASANLLYDNLGKPIGLVCIERDITQRKRSEQMLAESEDRHRALIEASSKVGIGIVMLQSTGDQEAVIIFANDGATQITGYSHEELLSQPLNKFIPPDELLVVLERYRSRQRGEPTVPYYETHIITKNGINLPVLISSATLKYQGKIASVVYFRDVTQIKEAEDKISRHAKNMEAILAVAQAVSQMPATNTMLMHALDKTNEALNADKSCIYLLDRAKKCLRMKACKGISDRNIRHYADLPLNETQLRNMQQWKTPLVPFEDIFGKSIANKMKAALEKNKAHSYIIVPLMIKDNVTGILYIVSDKDRIFTKEDTELLTALCYEIAIGIDNAELLERTIEMSLTDELTGLYNRRHFYDSLEIEMYRTKRYGQPFALALLDLNGFKEYNDRYGHASGDSILQMFAKALKSYFRKADIICRYGGDEFSIILPSTDDKTAKDIVERFRSKWSILCEKKALVDKSPMGFSCGITKFPDNSDSADGLVFLADAAMYCAKTGKENSSILASEMSAVSSDILRAATQDHIYALAATVDAKDPFTCGHSKRVADIAEKIGKAIGLPQKELSKIYSAALLHDIGKIGVPDSILTKPSHPTPEEWTILKNHPSEGAKIIGYVEGLNDLTPVILHHHEWYNGKGYPDGLQGKDIPIGARITSVADAYDTMTTERPYRNLISSQQACEELIKCSGTQFDPTLVKILCKTIQEAD